VSSIKVGEVSEEAKFVNVGVGVGKGGVYGKLEWE